MCNSCERAGDKNLAGNFTPVLMSLGVRRRGARGGGGEDAGMRKTGKARAEKVGAKREKLVRVFATRRNRDRTMRVHYRVRECGGCRVLELRRIEDLE